MIYPERKNQTKNFVFLPKFYKNDNSERSVINSDNWNNYAETGQVVDYYFELIVKKVL